MNKKVLIIQTAFIGDVILATALAESIYSYDSDASIDILVRKGNESLFDAHPFIKKVYVWNKKKNKYQHLLQLIPGIRKEQYDVVVNLQRFASTGLLTALSGSVIKVGFDKNPFSLFFNKKIKHHIITGMHEVDRNFDLISWFATLNVRQPKLYPSDKNEAIVKAYKLKPYICIAANSVWFTKQYPEHKWVDLMNALPASFNIYLLGAPTDKASCERIQKSSVHPNISVLAGTLSFLDSAALMRDAVMNYVNDSAPLHIASAMNAPVSAVFCSTIPAFGFGPLSTRSNTIETKVVLACKPCGLHGRSVCPEGHFKCAETIETKQLLQVLE